MWKVMLKDGLCLTQREDNRASGLVSLAKLCITKDVHGNSVALDSGFGSRHAWYRVLFWRVGARYDRSNYLLLA